MVGVTANGGTSGSLQILDAKRDLRNNVENTRTSFSISGYSSGYPNLILNFPSEIAGYVYSNTLGDVQIINYGTESATGSAGTFPARSTSIAVPPTFGHVYSAEEGAGLLGIIDKTTGGTYALNLPNVFQVVVNQGDTVILAMVRNSNSLYRVIKLNASQYTTSTAAIAAIGAVDCQPFNLPIYCVIPVNTGSNTSAFDRPAGAYFSLDGNTVYVLNCGAECGGTTSSITYLLPGALQVNSYTNSTVPAQQNPNAFSSNLPVPGGVTTAVSDGNNLYVAGQQRQPDGLFAGNLSIISLATNAVTSTVSISDGTHTKILFADDNTLWIGSQLCATGEPRGPCRPADRNRPGHRPERQLQLPHPRGSAVGFHRGQRIHRSCGHTERNVAGRRPLPQHEPEPVLLWRPDRPLLGPGLPQGLHRLRWTGPRLQHYGRLRDQQRQCYRSGNSARRCLPGRCHRRSQLRV
ncbi:hypothetical protein RBB78_10635 [Tunturiibacter empetritectus]|uniref:hypothetical protein n=1 Tax=Tunturiibacter empetritectus TaxID=3069691 RepID=UPI003D9AC9EE